MKSQRERETSEERETRLSNRRIQASTSRAAETSDERNSRLENQRARISAETSNQRENRLRNQCVTSSVARSIESSDQRETRLRSQDVRSSVARAIESTEQQESRLGSQRIRSSLARASESTEQRESRLGSQRIRSSLARASESTQQRESRLGSQRIRSSLARASESTQQRESRRGSQRILMSASRATETPEQRESRLRSQRVRSSVARATETSEQRESRLRTERSRSSFSRENETIDQNVYRRQQDSYRHRRIVPVSFERIAFNYTAEMDYGSHELIAIGSMNNVCRHCNAYKYKHETPGMCCSNGKIVLPQLLPPPQPLLSLMTGSHLDSQHFLSNIRKYNSAFQMTSFGATNVIRENFMPTFRVQGQIYHRMGSLLPIPNEDPKFLQIYFMGQADEQVQQRQRYNPETKQRVVADLQEMFHDCNQLIRTFKQARDDPRLCSDEHFIAIHADKTPAGQHQGRYNAPTIDDVAILIVGEPTAPRDIIIRRRDERVSRIAETHRSYDALQYPIIFPYGEDGYHFGLRQINTSTNEPTNKQVSSMNFYAYRIMIRRNTLNHIVNCRELFHQYIVDMYAKIETERLMYIRHNQSKLRVDNYIHLQDAINSNIDVNPNELGRAIILPATFTGSPRHMQEYTQDAMAYVRSY
ncbi:uncharacterized protein LOC133331174, partial [Musca vetustissima]|uniref:uncharacterized protein LOC133331174 n=1 Tax=Musca vetustissima TaxID=27455 RepID=UPI002AB68D9A